MLTVFSDTGKLIYQKDININSSNVKSLKLKANLHRTYSIIPISDNARYSTFILSEHKIKGATLAYTIQKTSHVFNHSSPVNANGYLALANISNTEASFSYQIYSAGELKYTGAQRLPANFQRIINLRKFTKEFDNAELVLNNLCQAGTCEIVATTFDNTKTHHSQLITSETLTTGTSLTATIPNKQTFVTLFNAANNENAISLKIVRNNNIIDNRLTLAPNASTKFSISDYLSINEGQLFITSSLPLSAMLETEFEKTRFNWLATVIANDGEVSYQDGSADTLPIEAFLYNNTHDSDNDGVRNDEEKALNLNPRNPDTNDNGINDGEEVFTINENITQNLSDMTFPLGISNISSSPTPYDTCTGKHFGPCKNGEICHRVTITETINGRSNKRTEYKCGMCAKHAECIENRLGHFCQSIRDNNNSNNICVDCRNNGECKDLNLEYASCCNTKQTKDNYMKCVQTTNSHYPKDQCEIDEEYCQKYENNKHFYQGKCVECTNKYHCDGYPCKQNKCIECENNADCHGVSGQIFCCNQKENKCTFVSKDNNPCKIDEYYCNQQLFDDITSGSQSRRGHYSDTTRSCVMCRSNNDCLSGEYCSNTDYKCVRAPEQPTITPVNYTSPSPSPSSSPSYCPGLTRFNETTCSCDLCGGGSILSSDGTNCSCPEGSTKTSLDKSHKSYCDCPCNCDYNITSSPFILFSSNGKYTVNITRHAWVQNLNGQYVCKTINETETFEANNDNHLDNLVKEYCKEYNCGYLNDNLPVEIQKPCFTTSPIASPSAS